jgi:hypothetical protein
MEEVLIRNPYEFRNMRPERAVRGALMQAVRGNELNTYSFSYIMQSFTNLFLGLIFKIYIYRFSMNPSLLDFCSSYTC